MASSYLTVGSGDRRTAAADCELAGQRIGEGDKVVVSFTSANRDEAVFAGAGREPPAGEAVRLKHVDERGREVASGG